MHHTYICVYIYICTHMSITHGSYVCFFLKLEWARGAEDEGRCWSLGCGTVGLIWVGRVLGVWVSGGDARCGEVVGSVGVRILTCQLRTVAFLNGVRFVNRLLVLLERWSSALSVRWSVGEPVRFVLVVSEHLGPCDYAFSACWIVCRQSNL